eukprot:437078-Amphidinium_carterae.1
MAQVMFTHWIHVGRLESDSTGLLMMLPVSPCIAAVNTSIGNPGSVGIFSELPLFRPTFWRWCFPDIRWWDS